MVGCRSLKARQSTVLQDFEPYLYLVLKARTFTFQGDSAVTPSASWHQPVESNDIKVKKEGESLEERLARLADSGGGGILGGGSNSSKNKTEPPASSGGGGAADDHVVDLDTRLKMLMQKSTKGTTGLPSFLAGLGTDYVSHKMFIVRTISTNTAFTAA